MWWLSFAALAAEPRVGAAGHAVSVTGEVLALSALPFLAGGTTGMTLAAVKDPAAYAESPYVELAYVGVGLAGVGVPMTIAGAELEASARRKTGQTVASHGDVAAWATYGAAFATLAVGLPVASAVGKDNARSGPIVVGAAGVTSTTLWLCSVGLGAGFRGSLADGASVALVPTGRGVALAGAF